MAEREKIEFDSNFDWALKKSETVNKIFLNFRRKLKKTRDKVLKKQRKQVKR